MIYSTKILENKSRANKELDSPLPSIKTVEIFITQKELSMAVQKGDQIDWICATYKNNQIHQHRFL